MEGGEGLRRKWEECRGRAEGTGGSGPGGRGNGKAAEESGKGGAGETRVRKRF